MKDMGNKISICRQNKNITQEELARRLGVTSQAVSKWERELSLPDVSLVKDLCEILEVSADYLLGVSVSKEQLAEGKDGNSIILSNLRNSLEQLELVFGRDILPLFIDNSFVEVIMEMRIRLSREGIILPIIRIRDDLSLAASEFRLLSCRKVLYSELATESIDLDYIINKLEMVCKENYSKLLSPDIIKLLTDNLREKYPALIDGIVPEKISYAVLSKVAKAFMEAGNDIVYLPRLLEEMQYYMLDNPNATAGELIQNVVVQG